jgi:hypothetical protein
MNRVSAYVHKTQIYFFVSVIFIILALSVALNYSVGFYNFYESDRFIAFYLSDTPFWEKIFDYRQTDYFWLWRGRDIGNIFNYLDSYVIFYSAKFGFPHFLSGIYYVVLFSIVSTQLWIAKKYGRKRFLFISFLLAIAFLVSPPIFLSGIYFRATKPIVTLAFALTATLLTSVAYTPNPSKIKNFLWMSIASIASLVMGLVDELGIALSLLSLMISLLLFCISNKKVFLWLCAGIAIGPIGSILYRILVGPYIIHRIVGITPSPWGIASFQYFTPKIFLDAWGEFSLYVRSFFGYIPPIATPFLFFSIFCLYLAIFIHVPIVLKKPLWLRVSWATLTYIAFMGFLFAMMFIMIVRTEGLFDIGWLLIYPLPFITALYIFINILLMQISLTKQTQYFLLITVLGILSLCNGMSIQTLLSDFTNPISITSPSFYLAHAPLLTIQHPEIPYDSLGNDISYAAIQIRSKLNPNAR